MAEVIRVIFRLDYDISHAFLDRRGSALRVLTTTVSDFWENIGEGAIPGSFLVEHKATDSYRQLSLEPTSINGSLEWSQGVQLERLITSEQFIGVDRIIGKLIHTCETTKIARAGIRLVCLETLDGSQPAKFLERQLSKELLGVTTGALGGITDTAVILEGLDEDKIEYRYSLGPLAKKNIDQNLPNIDNKEVKDHLLRKYAMFLDIDLFEKNIYFSSGSIGRWAQTKVAKAAMFVGKCRAVFAALGEA